MSLQFSRYLVIALCIDDAVGSKDVDGVYVFEASFASPKFQREYFQKILGCPSTTTLNGKEVGCFILPDGVKAIDVSMATRMARAKFTDGHGSVGTKLEIEGEYD
ncbi:MAG: hypothetical protein JRN21_09560 [Nitrososphaerota archaeon]|nr:hypothetical protein [Nitrososphaerota archaeon]